MTSEIRQVNGAGEIETVGALAHEIWNEHFPPIIGQAQVDYMLENLQSAPAISRQIADGYEYYLVRLEGQPAGYLALVPSVEEKAVQLSKLYVKSEHRGSGLGKAMVDFAERRCAELDAHTLWLTVNQHNAGPIAFYERRGFTRDGELVMDIGGGFVMQDYKMVKSVAGE